jgi:hypothetical protein
MQIVNVSKRATTVLRPSGGSPTAEFGTKVSNDGHKTTP